MSTPPINPSLEPRVLALTWQFEGGALTGNFDGQIASWGPLQWNLGSGTLQPLLRRIAALDPAALDRHAPGLRAALRTNADTVAWFRAVVHDPTNPAQARWSMITAFALLAATPAAQQAFYEASRPYLEKARQHAARLGLETERGLALMLDVAVQNGGVRADHLTRYWELAKTAPAFHEWERLKLLAIAVADSANPKWRSDVLARKLTIALGGTSNSGLRVHGRAVELTQFDIKYWLEPGVKAVWYGVA